MYLFHVCFTETSVCFVSSILALRLAFAFLFGCSISKNRLWHALFISVCLIFGLHVHAAVICIHFQQHSQSHPGRTPRNATLILAIYLDLRFTIGYGRTVGFAQHCHCWLIATMQFDDWELITLGEGLADDGTPSRPAPFQVSSLTTFATRSPLPTLPKSQPLQRPSFSTQPRIRAAFCIGYPTSSVTIGTSGSGPLGSVSHLDHACHSFTRARKCY